MSALYNEIDPFAVRWLRNLISAGHIADGAVDERSIADLVAADVAGPGQRHFFAGIAGWSHALRLAGVPDDADVWTGSCPCQGFSSAGKRKGFDDDRHLWPEWFRLISECRPAVVFGEQVASGLGLEWLDLVFADLEGAGYACAAADLCAAGAGAPHQRQRLFFVAYADGQSGRLLAARRQPGRADAQTERCSETLLLADATRQRWHGVPRDTRPRREQSESPRGGEAGDLAYSEATRRRARRIDRSHGRTEIEPRGHRHDGWSACDWLPCSDGVSRPVEPGTHPLAHGVPGRVGLLRGYGNAIVPQVAAAFIRAALGATP